MSKLNELRNKIGVISTQLSELDAMLIAGFPQQELIAMLAERSAATVENKAVMPNDAANTEEVTAAPVKKNGNGNGKKKKSTAESKYIGKEIEYGGGRAKIVSKSDDGGFTAKALTNLTVDEKSKERGHEFNVSNTYVYRQLKAKK